jgi:hypothetical protein
VCSGGWLEGDGVPEGFEPKNATLSFSADL